MADRRLGDTQDPRGPREAADLSKRCENAQQSEIKVCGHSCTMFIIMLKNNHHVHVNLPCGFRKPALLESDHGITHKGFLKNGVREEISTGRNISNRLRPAD
jgi:hypothetical protein